MYKSSFFVIIFFAFGIPTAFSQNATIEGYVYEEDNRGYLKEVTINVYDQNSNDFITQLNSDVNGFFSINLPVGRLFRLEAQKELFENKIVEADTRSSSQGDKVFVKLELSREPGYIFEVTLAPKRESEDTVVTAISGALIEVYNNTTQEEVMVLADHPSPVFNVNFKDGNHYTILVRKKGYLTKRMEAFVNVEGCILCFEGVGEVRPGVIDNLTSGLKMGTLLANVEMVPVFSGKVIELQNISYAFGKSNLTKKGEEELSKLASIMNDNPFLKVELGSHTDVRGKDSANRSLSEKRAQSAVDFLTKEMKIRKDRIIAVGYGESRIKNRCKSGVECTEEEHAVNRRTEIKILELGSDRMPLKSLFSMKKEEEFEKMILGGGVEMMENGKSDEVEKVDDANMESVEEVAESTSLEDMEVTEIMVKEDVASSARSDFDEKSESKIQETQNAPIKKRIDKEKDLEKSDSSSRNAIRYQNERAFLEKRKAEKEGKVKSVANANNEEAYTGSRIVIHFSRFPLSADHEIYDKFEKVETYETPQKNLLYMIGEFETKEQAEKYRLLNLMTSFPNAYVIEFKNGQRIN